MDFPVTTGAFDESHNGRADVFVSRLDLNQTGVNQLVYSTLLGGTGLDQCGDMHVDQNGVVTIVGDTDSAMFPTTPDGFDLVFFVFIEFPSNLVFAILQPQGG